MRRSIACLLVLALAAPIPAQAQSGDLLYLFPAQDSITSVDLLDDAGKAIVFRVDPDVFDVDPAQVLLEMRCDCGASISRTMSRSGDVWTVSLAVGHEDLVVGTWAVEPRATSSFGQSHRIEGRTLEVGADDDAPPTVAVRDLNGTTNTVHLGAGAMLVIDAQDPLLRHVTYQVEGMPQPVRLQAPYQLRVDTFKTGASEITVNATDRAGHATQVNLTVYADDRAPVVSTDLPDRLFDGVPNPLEFVIREDSTFNVTVRGVNATTRTSHAGDPDPQVVALDIVPRGLGERLLEILVVDELENSVRILHPVRVDPVDVDVHLMEANVSGGPAIVGEALTLSVQAQQRTALIDVPVDVYFGDILVGGIILPAYNATGNGTNTTVHSIVNATLELKLPPGTHAGPVRLVAPEGVNETLPGDESLPVPAEVFLGRVIHGDERYHIRTVDGNLPSRAVGPNGTTYDLRLEDEALRSVYAFDVGDTRLYWDPSTNTTTVPEPEVDDGKDSPGLGVLVLPALAATALLRRRR